MCGVLLGQWGVGQVTGQTAREVDNRTPHQCFTNLKVPFGKDLLSASPLWLQGHRSGKVERVCSWTFPHCRPCSEPVASRSSVCEP